MMFPKGRDELRAFLKTLKVEHGHVNPDDIPGYWDEKRDEHRAAKEKAA